MTDDICPPHFFLAAWRNENDGVLFCRMCGEVRELNPATIEAPDEEKVEVSDDTAA